MTYSTARLPVLSAVTILVLLAMGAATSGAQEALSSGAQEADAGATGGRDAIVYQPLSIDEVSHINHVLVLIDGYERRFRLPDGTYANDSGRSIVIRDGKIVQLKGCADADCTVTAHATRVGNQLSIYAEMPVPDGTFRTEVGDGDEAREVLFTIEGGRLTSFLDPAQQAFSPESAMSEAAPEASRAAAVSEPG